MTTAMLNVRLDKGLKAQGERVLARQGVTATEAVRGLYRLLSQTDEVPDARGAQAKDAPARWGCTSCARRRPPLP